MREIDDRELEAVSGGVDANTGESTEENTTPTHPLCACESTARRRMKDGSGSNTGVDTIGGSDAGTSDVFGG